MYGSIFLRSVFFYVQRPGGRGLGGAAFPYEGKVARRDAESDEVGQMCLRDAVHLISHLR